MSNKKKASQAKLGQGTMKKLADLEELILQDEAADFSASESAPQKDQAQQAELNELATLEDVILQDSPEELAEATLVADEDALLDSIAELESDFLYEALGVVETAVSEQPPVETAVEALEAEILAELDSDEVVVETPVETVAETIETLPLADALADEQPLADMSEAIEMAFAVEEEDETADLVELPALEPEVEAAPVADEWDALADVEADFLLTPETAVVGEFAELSDLETDLFQTELAEADTDVDVADEADEDLVVAEETAVVEPDDPFAAYFAEADEQAEAEAAELLEAEVEEEETAVVAVEDAQEAEDLEFIAELEAEDHHFLDDLIASIDTELAAVKSAEAMIDLAAPTDAETETFVQHVIFTLGSVKCAVPATNIREVGEINYITAVPNVPDWLLGITSLRGDILSLVDLGAFLGVAQPQDIGAHRIADVEIMVVQSQEDPLAAITTGLVVDEVDDIQDIPLELVRIPTATIDNQLGSYMRGVYEHKGQMIVLLDLERLLMSPEMWQFEAI